MAEPTIPERLRRLHHLYSARAAAFAAIDATGSDRFRRILDRRIDTECEAILAAADERGCTAEERQRLGSAFGDLSGAAYEQARQRLMQDAYRAGEKSGAFEPKSQLVEERRHHRQRALGAEQTAHAAIRDALAALQIAETNG
ncbi:hypothetical protein [Glycomyces tarimensis]